MTAESLSAADRGSLQAERGPVNMAVAGTLIFEGGPGTTYDAVAERIASRLHLVPRYGSDSRIPRSGCWPTRSGSTTRSSTCTASQGLSVGVLSYDGNVFFGLLADARLDPPVDVAAQALRDALDEVAALA